MSDEHKAALLLSILSRRKRKGIRMLFELKQEVLTAKLLSLQSCFYPLKSVVVL